MQQTGKKKGLLIVAVNHCQGDRDPNNGIKVNPQYVVDHPNGIHEVVMRLKVVEGEPVEVEMQRDQEVNHKLNVMKMEKLLHATSTPNADNLSNKNTER